MRTSRRFVPGDCHCVTNLPQLETRIVMTSNATSIGPGVADDYLYANLMNGQSSVGRRFAPNLVSAYSRGVHLKDAVNTRVSDAIDRSFDTFISDYIEAQSAYLADKNLRSKDAFIATTTQRVVLLKQELTQILARVPGTLNRNTGSSANSLQQFLNRQIIGNRPRSVSLLKTLTDTQTTVPPIDASGPSVTLYTLTAMNAIESARVATVNATKFSASGIFRK